MKYDRNKFRVNLKLYEVLLIEKQLIYVYCKYLKFMEILQKFSFTKRFKIYIFIDIPSFIKFGLTLIFDEY